MNAYLGLIENDVDYPETHLSAVIIIAKTQEEAMRKVMRYCATNDGLIGIRQLSPGRLHGDWVPEDCGIFISDELTQVYYNAKEIAQISKGNSASIRRMVKSLAERITKLFVI